MSDPLGAGQAHKLVGVASSTLWMKDGKIRNSTQILLVKFGIHVVTIFSRRVAANVRPEEVAGRAFHHNDGFVWVGLHVVAVVIVLRPLPLFSFLCFVLLAPFRPLLLVLLPLLFLRRSVVGVLSR